MRIASRTLGLVTSTEERRLHLQAPNLLPRWADHHGAENGRSEDLLRAMSPKLAVISMGDRSSQKPSTAYDHGHPRLATIRDTPDAPDRVSMTRTPIKFWGAEGQEQPFKPVTIKRATYGTGWEGTLVVKAKANGQYTIVKP